MSFLQLLKIKSQRVVNNKTIAYLLDGEPTSERMIVNTNGTYG